VRDRALHSILEAFTAEAAGQLAAETAQGAEIQFELAEVERRAGRVPLYCYRPLTEGFIDERFGLLSTLPTYVAAARALAVTERVGAYLITRGEPRIPSEPRARAESALRVFLRTVFAERSEFGFDPARFEAAYAELEDTLYEGQSLTTVVAPLLGVAIDAGTDELLLGDGLSLIRGDALEGAPEEAALDERGEAHVLAMLAVAHEPGRQPPLSLARTCFRRLLTALRLFEHGGYALGPLAWMRVGNGPWRAVPIGSSGRPGIPVLIGADQEDELRGFCNLLERRVPISGQVAWALSRFEMGAERSVPFEALTDYLLALRALLAPEGTNDGLLAERLAAICVPPQRRAEVAARTARALALEREVIAGGAPSEPGADELIDQLCGHLRALLRDIICGHLAADLVALADDLLAAPPEGDPADPLPRPVPAPAG
jgi:hypothetical protein